MTDIVVGTGKVNHWESGDEFKIGYGYNLQLSFFFEPAVSEERTALLKAMQNRTDVEVIVRVPND